MSIFIRAPHKHGTLLINTGTILALAEAEAESSYSPLPRTEIWLSSPIAAGTNSVVVDAAYEDMCRVLGSIIPIRVID